MLVAPLLAAPPAQQRMAAPAPVDFEREVRPLLARRCYACHGPGKQAGGLRLFRRQDALLGGDGGTILVPGKSAESRLLAYVEGRVEGKVMPPVGPRLTAAEVDLLRRWIDAGASWPEEAATEKATQPSHWSLRAVRRPPAPRVSTPGWVVNPVDAFVLVRLEKAGLRPSPPADRVTLLRRVTLDLIGLPPTVPEVDAFLADRKPGAYERVVDRLLASPRYGERWAQPWLDLARYADSNGYTIDGPRQMWMYRDWVINALNADLPFDRFTVEQLAGDMLPHPTRDHQIATGFHRNTLFNEEGGTDPEQFRVEAVVDRVNTTGTVWLGLTVGCAQCHTHKYDPITQREYYQFLALFNGADEPTLDFPTPEQAAQRKELAPRLEAARAALKAWDAAHPAEMAAANAKNPERAALAAQVTELEKESRTLEGAVSRALVMRERDTVRPTFVHLRGDFLRHGAPVQPGVPSVLPPLRALGKQPNRLDLARWLVAPGHPLTARVTVNRFWQQLFPHGLVETENDFGTQGPPPTHPELLDWLASSFAAPRSGPGSRNCGWSVKRLLRLLVTSNTYRQSSQERADARAKDPLNRLLARQGRLRLSGEAIRDSALAASGLLSGKIGGPSVFPPQPAGTDLFTQVKKNWTPSTGEDRYRRGLYTWHWRSSPYPLFAALDAPDRNVACTRRARSNTPLQSLMLANDETFLEAATALAEQVLTEAPPNPAARLRLAFRRCLARQPAPAELQRLREYYTAQLETLAGGTAEMQAEKQALAAVARVLINLDEFITRE
jgi:mono/diheme cytochrome c family protein